MQHNLPHPSYQRLVGRDTQIADILRRLDPDSRHWLIAIEGMAGVGKTALALEIGWRCATADQIPTSPAPRFDACVWASSVADTTASIPSADPVRSHTSLDDIFIAIAHVLDTPYVLRLPEPERRTHVRRLLAGASPVLLIIDNLDATHTDSIMPFLRELPRPSKAIVTLRVHEDVPYPIRLEPLDDSSTQDLIRALCDAQRLTLREDEIVTISSMVGGIPLAAQWAVGLVREYGMRALRPHLPNHARAMLRHLFTDTTHRLRRTQFDAYLVLLALSLFDLETGASSSALAATTSMEISACEHTIAHLLQLNLISRSNPDHRLVMLPLTSAYVQNELTQDPSLEGQLRAAWIAFYRRFLDAPHDVVRYIDWRPEWSNIRHVMEWLAARDMMDELAWFFIQIHEFLLFEGLWEPLLSFADQLASWAELSGNLDTLAAILPAPVGVFVIRGNPNDGEGWLDRARRVLKLYWKEPLPRRQRLEAEVMLAAARLHDRDTATQVDALTPHPVPEDADARMEQALSYFRSNGDADGVMRTLYARGNHHRGRRHYPNAAQWYRVGLDQLPTLFASDPTREASWRPLLRSRLALVTGRQGRHAEARDMLSEVVSDLHEPLHQIEALAALAYYEHVTGRAHLATQHRLQADQLKGRHRITTPICLEDARWGQWTLS